jgi:hypothetical protein
MKGIAWLKNLWRGNRLDRELDDELRAYVNLLSDDYRARGYSPEAARGAARIEAGAIEPIKEEVRDARSGAWLETLWQDARFGVRLLGRSPSFATAAIVSLALGIGANSAVFGLLNALRLRSLPVRDAAQLAEVRLDGPRCCRHTGRNRQVSLPLWNEIRTRQQAFSTVFAFADTRYNLAPTARFDTSRRCSSRGTSFRHWASRRHSDAPSVSRTIDRVAAPAAP